MLTELPYSGSNKFELRRCWSTDARAALFTISFKGNWLALASSKRAKLLVKLASCCLLLDGKKGKNIKSIIATLEVPWIKENLSGCYSG